MAQVIVLIDPKGKVVVEADGVRGEGCSALTERIEAAVGRSTDKQFKPERWVSDHAAQAQG